MATDSGRLIRLFAEENRVRAFAAVALGAGSPAQVAGAAGLSARETAVALHRLAEQGVVTERADGELAVAYEVFREQARRERAEEDPAASASGASGASGDDFVLRTFVRDGRLVRLPARWTRKKVVLRHIAEQTFDPGVEYPERTVNERLRAWCEESDDIDHVSLRRYLVDLGHLGRSAGVYRRAS
ncbi:DUF2087 domain-containing protein [Streptomyces sp. NPDC047072]|uniref:DUF2087 domain-containing protein n=1 Tax=Streptomyces sp. NPDC047072 TaxID=3154809 RepID=UPI0033DC02E1